MAHGLTKFDGMFSVREKPWHGLGVVLPELATAREAIEAASLDWTVEKRPSYYVTASGEFAQIPGRYAIVRTDLDIALGGGVGEQYTPLQNTEAFAFMDAICQDPGGPKFVTAGSIYEGRRVWMLVKMPSFVEISNTDVVEEYLLLANSHDGTRSIEVLWTPIRVVCQNTLNLALGSNKPGRVTLRHTSNLIARAGEIGDMLGICRQKHEQFTEIVNAFRAYEPTTAEVDAVCKRLFASSEREKETSAFRQSKEGVLRFFRDGEANTTAGDTSSAWALYNGITEYADYGRPERKGMESADAKLDRNWFGSSVSLKARAMTEIAELVR